MLGDGGREKIKNNKKNQLLRAALGNPAGSQMENTCRAGPSPSRRLTSPAGTNLCPPCGTLSIENSRATPSPSQALLPHSPHCPSAAPYQPLVLQPQGGPALAGGTGGTTGGRALGHVPGWWELAAGCLTGAAGLRAGVLGREKDLQRAGGCSPSAREGRQEQLQRRGRPSALALL